MLSEKWDSLIPIKKAPKHIPTNPSLATVYRWFQKGCRGVILQTVLIGGRRFTKPAWIDEFIASTQSTPDASLTVSEAHKRCEAALDDELNSS